MPMVRMSMPLTVIHPGNVPAVNTSGSPDEKPKKSNTGIDIRTIGIFALVGLPYTVKFLWSPLMDRFIPPFAGRRRGWIIATQIGLIIGIGALAMNNPQDSLL